MHYKLLDENEEHEEMNIEKTKEQKEDLEMNKFLMDEESDGSCACVRKLSNQTVLMITCALFAAFVVAEIIGALVRATSLHQHFSWTKHSNILCTVFYRQVIRYHCWEMQRR